MHTEIDHYTADLDAILADCWFMLKTGAKRANSPFHTPVIGTMNSNGCSLRTVVLRRVMTSRRLLICHTDRRSVKVAELENHNRLSWLFYDPEKKIQIRAGGLATLHFRDTLADEQWSRTRLMSRRFYCGENAPGTIQPTRSSGLPKKYADRAPLSGESEECRENFTVISCKLDSLDWLYLDARGHSRAQFLWYDERLEAHWVIP